jgi:hypothetical protein
LSGSTIVHLARGERLGVNGKVAVVLLGQSNGAHNAASGVVLFGNGLLNPLLAHTLVAVQGPLTVRIGPAGAFGAALCPHPRG